MYEKVKIPNINKRPLKYVFENNLVKEGLWCEFGVFTGNTINYFSKFTKERVHGFDTFTGLPNDWVVDENIKIEKGYYSYRDYAKFKGIESLLPSINDNIILHEGLFLDKIPEFTNEYKEPITFIHVDCDIYESTKDVFELIGKHIVNGCVIVFDELINYPNYKEHEFKAFYEWVNTNNIIFDFIGMDGEFVEKPETWLNKENQSVAIRIIDNPKYEL